MKARNSASVKMAALVKNARLLSLGFSLKHAVNVAPRVGAISALRYCNEFNQLQSRTFSALNSKSVVSVCLI